MLRDVRDRRAVADVGVDPLGGPGQVVVELVARREERLVVDEVHEPVAFVQVVEEGEPAPRIAERDQVLRERDLHRRPVEQHAGMPPEALLTFHEHGPDALVIGACLVVFLDRDRQREIRRSETDTHDVEYFWTAHASPTRSVPDRIVAWTSGPSVSLA